MKSILFITFLLVANIYYAQDAYKSIYGTITTPVANEPVVFATIELKSGNSTFKTSSDIDGKFQFDHLPNGNYTVQILSESSSTNYTQPITIDTLSSDTLFRDFMFQDIQIQICILRIPYPIPQNPTLTHWEIQHSVNKFQLADLLQGISSNILRNGTDDISLNGARTNDYLFLIDQVKCRELHQVPAISMKSVTVLSHFIPAKYGDTTGGVILVETMSYIDLYNEWERRSGF